MYILRCADGTYYLGHTDNLEQRVNAHAQGAIPSCYTESRRPVSLVIVKTWGMPVIGTVGIETLQGICSPQR